MKILITGANGFTGASLCRYFHKKGHQIIATGRQSHPPAELLNYAQYLPADLTQPLSPIEADACIHAAGLASDTAPYQQLHHHNVEATSHLLNAVHSCKCVAYISSSSVYKFSNRPVVESDAGDPPTDYGRTKLQAEQLMQNNIPAGQHRLILRPRAIYGLGDRVLLPRLLKFVKSFGVINPVNENIYTSATHVDHIATAIELFLHQPEPPQRIQVYNISDEHAYRLRDILIRIASAVEGKSRKTIDLSPALMHTLVKINSKFRLLPQLTPVALQALTKSTLLDITAICDGLHYKPVHSFDQSSLQLGEWVQRLGGRKAYLSKLADAPWLVDENT